jgi:hypothetical protein
VRYLEVAIHYYWARLATPSKQPPTKLAFIWNTDMYLHISIEVHGNPGLKYL